MITALPPPKPGHRALVGHRPGQVQHIGERLLLRAVRVEAGAAERRPQHRGVDGDDGTQAGPPVVAEHHLLVADALVEDSGPRRCAADPGGFLDDRH
jgi:hypothetical protein